MTAEATGGNRILLVDDDQALARALQRWLVAAGYEVVVAEDGIAALEIVAGRTFDVIVSDIQMPGLSGIELLRRVRTHDLDVPVVLMTGNPSIDGVMEAIGFGVLAYLTKPMTKDVFLETVRRASNLHRMARLKRDALRLVGGEDAAGDLAGLEAAFERTLETMWIAFQPIVDSGKQSVFGYEALMRAREPSLPHPGAILEAAERLHRLPALGRRVRGLAAEGFAGAPEEELLFVNLHPRDLLDPELFDPSAPLSRLARRVVLEITERSTLDEVEDVPTRIATLRQLGFRIAIDDLGAGYAGLSSFAALQPEIVKLDMSLIRDVHRSEVRKRIVATMTSLCKEMEILVVAEGIESAEERDCVVGFGCALLQGYFFAKPGPAFPAVAASAFPDSR